jgi:PTS system mannose-specific IIB component/fructoselysine and glucoselysine-specific PTS system IIB component
MPILLYRVDERLIHGQVVLGWGGRLHPNRYLVVDDAVASSEWEQELYRLSVDESKAEVVFVSVAEARERLAAWRDDPARSILLTRDLDAMVGLAGSGDLEDEEVNVGGIHHRPGRRAVTPYVHLDQADLERIGRLVEAGVRVSARDLPETQRVGLDAHLDR